LGKIGQEAIIVIRLVEESLEKANEEIEKDIWEELSLLNLKSLGLKMWKRSLSQRKLEGVYSSTKRFRTNLRILSLAFINASTFSFPRSVNV